MTFRDRLQRAHDPERMPPLWRQAINAGRAAGRVVAAVASGDELRVSDAEYRARLAVCRTCPNYNPVGTRCRHKACGCYLRRKAKLQTEQCPEDRWPKPEGTQ